MRRGSGFVFPFSLMRAGVVVRFAVPALVFPFFRFCRSVVSAVACSSPSLDAVEGSCARSSALLFFFLPADALQNGARKTGEPGMYGVGPGYTLSNLEAKQTMYKMASKSKSIRIGRFSRSSFSVGTFYVLYGSRKIQCLKWCII